MRRTSALLAALALAATGAATAGTTASSAAPAPLQRVIVQGSSVAAAADAVRSAGGRVLVPLAIVNGVSAELPAGRVPSGTVVTPDAAVTMDGGVGGTEDPTTKSVYRYETGADALGPAVHTGAAAPAVAVIDTGIDVGTASAPSQLADNVRSVPDPYNEGETVPCANFSSEPGCQDSYGHGTFMAGIIAGDEGMAPAARLVSVKIAGRSGSADVSQLLAAIQYVVSFREDLNIKVLNLSLGSNSTNDYRVDPVNRAVQKAWQSGITVVVSASNRGPNAKTISKPADDPLVLTVGAIDDRQTPSVTDDTVPAFSGRGPVTFANGSITVAKPDVVAPGVGILSLDVAGSKIAEVAGQSTYPVPGYRRGSGTSQAAAVVSGAAALLLERKAMTPDEVKQALKTTTTPVTGDPTAVGTGLVNVARALTAPVAGFTQAPVTVSDTLSGLDASRAQLLVTSDFGCGPAPSYYRAFVDPKCDYVHGNESTNGMPFSGDEYADSEWTGQSWYASQWVTGQSWYGQSWYGQSWYGQSWYGQSWYGYGGGTPPTEGTTTPLGTVLQGSAFYGVWS